jgi:hypothetical protein
VNAVATKKPLATVTRDDLKVFEFGLRAETNRSAEANADGITPARSLNAEFIVSSP